MGSIRGSLAYTFTGGAIVAGLQLVGNAIVARLLTPADLGVWAVAAVFALLASTLRDFGVTEYVIQERDLTPAKLQATFAAALLLSLVTGTGLALASGAIADFYREPGIASVLRIQALGYCLMPLGALTFAYCRRNLDYRPFFWASVLSTAANVVVAVAGAAVGLGYFSLAWAALAGVAVTVVVGVYARPAQVPGRPALRGMLSVLDFGRHMIAMHVVGHIGRSSPEIILGRALGVAPVGFFGRAQSLSQIFNQTVVRGSAPIYLPYLARESRRSRDLRPGLLRTMSYVTAIGWPVFAFLAAMAFPTIRILYGSQWSPSVPLARILSTAAAVEITYLLAKEALIAGGDARAARRLQVVLQALRIGSVLATLPFLEGACWGLLAAALAGAAWTQRVLARRMGLPFGDVARACAPSLAIALISTAPVLLWAWLGRIGEDNYLVTATVASACFAVLWLASLLALRHPCAPSCGGGSRSVPPPGERAQRARAHLIETSSPSPSSTTLTLARQ